LLADWGRGERELHMLVICILPLAFTEKWKGKLDYAALFSSKNFTSYPSHQSPDTI
jgi:hypothetical protein